jgi:hypothetical protein
MAAKDPERLVMLATHVDPSLAKAFADHAATQDRTVAAELRRLVRAHLDESNGGPREAA